MQQIVLDIGLTIGPTLANFFTGSNAAAYQHLKECVDRSKVALPLPTVPTYLWGSNGSGKTHLLQAVKLSLQQQGGAVGWLDASVQQPVEFDPSWVAIMLDEVDQYDASQQHTAFNWFVNAQTQACWVLAAGGVPPADLALREDLRTRLAWGPVFALLCPSETERRAVLSQAARERGLRLSNEVIDFMLNRFSRDLGSLMQLLEQLDQYALQTQRAITIPLIHAMMENS
ncbi:MAG: DnaA regulatory inactivator Hda [Burkholderiaceae bacterium]